MEIKRIRIVLFIFVFALCTSNAVALPAEGHPHIGMLAEMSTNPALVGMERGTYRVQLISVDSSLNTGSQVVGILRNVQYENDLLYIPKSLLDTIRHERFALNASLRASAEVRGGLFSAGIATRAVAEVAVARDVFVAMAEGFEADRKYEFDGTRLGGVAFTDVSAAFAWPLAEDMFIGSRYHRLIGKHYFDAHFTGGGFISPNQRIWQGDVRLQLDEMTPDDPLGLGHAFDAGIVWQFAPRWTFALSVADVGYIDLPSVNQRLYSAGFQLEQVEDGIQPILQLDNENTSRAMRWYLPIQYETALFVDVTNTVQAGLSLKRAVHTDQDGFVQSTYNHTSGHVRWRGEKWRPTVMLQAQYTGADEWRFAGKVHWRAGPLEASFGTTDFDFVSRHGADLPFGFVMDFRVNI